MSEELTIKESTFKKHWIALTFTAWMILGVIIAFTTYKICGSMWPIFYDTIAGSPKYSFLQRFLFSVAKLYSWPVTKLFHVIRNPIFDVWAHPFAVEVADIKFGPTTVIIIYALFYTSCTRIVVKLWTAYKKAAKKSKDHVRG